LLKRKLKLKVDSKDCKKKKDKKIKYPTDLENALKLLIELATPDQLPAIDSKDL